MLPCGKIHYNLLYMIITYIERDYIMYILAYIAKIKHHKQLKPLFGLVYIPFVEFFNR